MNGLLLIDKPQGVSSHDVVRRVRRIFKTRKVGHAGTLDPLATGLLLVALGDGTRILQFMLESEKGYRATLKLGAATDTQDSEGKIVSSASVEGISEEDVFRAAESFRGEISQIPPMFSALKKDGVPLYKLARKGVEVERKARQIFIDRLEILNINFPFVEFEVDCTKGTYVRTLCHDIGQVLGCGAHMTELRRISSGAFDVSESIPLDDLGDAEKHESLPYLLSVTEALRGYPQGDLNDEAAALLANGVPPCKESVVFSRDCSEGEMLTLLHKGELRAVTRFEPSRVNEKRGDFKLLRVFHGN